jgi:hypothetical protein
MIHHLSIAAKDPQRAARAIAALWRGEAFPFPPVGKGSWVAMAGDARNSTIEVYAFGAELHPAEGDADSYARMNPDASAYTPTHAAIDTPLTEAEVFALAAEHGWTAKYRKRGGIFGVIEFWIEDCVMLEVLTAEMQAEYLTNATLDGFRAMLANGPPKAA